MKKNRNGPPKISPNKEKAPTVAGPEGAFDKHSPSRANSQNVQANDTTDRLKVNLAPPIDEPKPIKSRLHNQSNKSLTGFRHWSVVENFKQSMVNAITIQPVLFDVNGSPPVTTRQINCLVKLYHQAGRKKFARIKNDLGLTSKVPDLTRHEASLLIKTLQQRDDDQKSHWNETQQKSILELG